ncbi:cytochrome-c peroxidase [Thalassolituus oleivorans]|uniref:cytochrome-c peroxidase n=1 Tax=Thalassolituus oleivorans TaxID=187493 RepID=UPI0023F2FC2C|nr:cytochrome c peroxidase [Thalassolituus oleivorans]MDF1641182.1 cytochrome c peroxidase [Thalassolituus oleivorans]
MLILKKRVIALTCALLLAGCGGDSNDSSEPAFTTKSALGEALFRDNNLSFNRTQSCATCHSPEHAFIDPRLNAGGEVSAVSRGDDAVSFGDRNAPTAMYAAFSPLFQFGTHARFNSQQPDYSGWLGGQFFDGRADDLQAQAAGPLVNSIEMAMPDKASVIDRVLANSDYVEAFTTIYGSAIFDDVDAAYDAVTDSIATFEKTDAFAPFSSKYDRSLRGEYTYDPLSKAAQGKALFFSQQFTACATCHQLNANSSKTETFTNYEYHNIGVPINTAARALNGAEAGAIDSGLLANNAVTDEAEKGKFKVPTLRNIAVTAPYMHNGVFRDLATVIKFYDHFLTDSNYAINPETGVAWADAEVSATISLTELQDGNKMDDADIDAMVCFLRTLTDERYEALIPDDGLICD